MGMDNSVGIDYGSGGLAGWWEAKGKNGTTIIAQIRKHYKNKFTLCRKK